MRDGWAEVTLGSVATQRFDPIELNDTTPYSNLGVKWYAAGTFQRDAKLGADIKASKLFRVRPGQFVYNRLFATEGSFAIVRHEDANAVASNEFPVFDLDESQILGPYLYLYFQQPSVWKQVSEQCVGTTKSRLRWKEDRFLAYRIPVPPLREQRRIADLIGAVDDAIGAAQASAASLEPAWWAMTRALEDSVKGRDTKPLGTISDIHGGLTKNKKDVERADAVEAPYLRVANVHRRRLDLSEVTMIVASRPRVEAAQLLPGDLLMNEGGDRDKLGRGAIWRGEVPGCTHQNHVFRVRITDPEFVPEFVSSWANSFGQKWFEVHGSQTTGIASVSKTTLSRFPVPSIAREEQVNWVELLDPLTEHQWQAEAFVNRLRALRSNMLTALLSGDHEIPESYDELMEEAP